MLHWRKITVESEYFIIIFRFFPTTASSDAALMNIRTIIFQGGEELREGPTRGVSRKLSPACDAVHASHMAYDRYTITGNAILSISSFPKRGRRCAFVTFDSWPASLRQ